MKISEGLSVGHKKTESLPSYKYRKIRLSITENVEIPIIKTFNCYYTNN